MKCNGHTCQSLPDASAPRRSAATATKPRRRRAMPATVYRVTIFKRNTLWSAIFRPATIAGVASRRRPRSVLVHGCCAVRRDRAGRRRNRGTLARFGYRRSGAPPGVRRCALLGDRRRPGRTARRAQPRRVGDRHRRGPAQQPPGPGRRGGTAPRPPLQPGPPAGLGRPRGARAGRVVRPGRRPAHRPGRRRRHLDRRRPGSGAHRGGDRGGANTNGALGLSRRCWATARPASSPTPPGSAGPTCAVPIASPGR
ncbi:hypothetical protein MAV_3423 [Mycobacterium avium 104]|uniref:Uncharacterized protein n=1 Tax=Mycobacterium avium (strain 104) TaxID=243243 RepID=A0A0H2ZXS7_MYCA1|nr:hypothetical protein MAV_3423 [Mycobacterium avium 104]